MLKRCGFGDVFVLFRHQIKTNMEKTITIKKHPYAFDVKVTFGTREEMETNSWFSNFDGIYELKGGFNKAIATKCAGRASYIAIGVKMVAPNEWKAICISHWEGIYGIRDWFDEELKQGLFPISAEWDGKTYIERSKYSGKDKNGVPIVSGTYYEQVDTFRY